MLVTYRGVVRAGKVHLQDTFSLPDGTEVIVVAQQRPEVTAQQEQRLASLPSEEWDEPFEALADATRKYPAEMDIELVTDEELVELVHEVREKYG